MSKSKPLPAVRIVGVQQDKYQVKLYDRAGFVRDLTKPTTLPKANIFAQTFALTNGFEWISPDPEA